MKDLIERYHMLSSRPRSPHAVPKPYTFLELELQFDVQPLLAELRGAQLPWSTAPWKWHHETKILVLRAGPSESGPQALVTGAGVDQPVLETLPRLRRFLDEAFGAPTPVAWLGLSPPGARIFLHGDNTDHWDRHHRVHIPLETNPDALLCVGERFQHFPAGSVWAFNNSRVHGAVNHGPDRIHLVIDLPDTEEAKALLSSARPRAGVERPELLAELEKDPRDSLDAGHVDDPALLERLRAQ